MLLLLLLVSHRLLQAPSLPLEAAASSHASLAELVLHVCGEALYPHLCLVSRRILRLASKTARDAVDRSVQQLSLGAWQSADVLPEYHSSLAVCTRRWPGAKQLACKGLQELPSLQGLPPGLQVLNLSRSMQRCTAQGVAPLAQVTHALKILVLRELELDSAGAAVWAPALCQLTSLRSLQLMDCCLQQGGLAFLVAAFPALAAGLEELTIVEVLSGGRFTSDDYGLLASYLPVLRNLLVLKLQTRMASDDAAIVAPALSQLPRLHHLGLRGDMCVCDRGVTEHQEQEMVRLVCVLAPLLSTLPLLHELDLSCKGLCASSPGFHELLNQAPQLRLLDLGWNCLNGAGEQLAGALRLAPHLTALDLSAAGLCEDDLRTLMPTLKDLRQLAFLNLAKHGLSGTWQPSTVAAAAAALPSMTALRCLTLAGIELDAVGALAVMAPLARLTGLEKLCLGNMRLGARHAELLAQV